MHVEHALRLPGHAEEDHEVGEEHRHRGAGHPEGRDQREVEQDADHRGDPGDDPVRPAAPDAPDRGHDDDVRAEDDEREGEDRHDARPVVEVRRRQQADDPRRGEAEGERCPGREERDVGEDEAVGAARLVVLPDRVRERGPRGAERGEHEEERRGDTHPDRVQPELVLALDPHEQEPVREVDRVQRDHRGHERHAPLGHLAEDVRVELEPELCSAVGEEDGVDGKRPAEVPDEDPKRPLVEDDDEQDRHPDRQRDVREARRRVADRALLDSKERRQLVVVHRRPEADEGRTHEVGVHI